MKTWTLPLATVVATVAAISYAGTAHALGPVDIEIAARGGFATNPSSGDFSANPFGGGIGGRAGVSVFGIYGGISGMYYFGGSANVPSPALDPSGSLSVHTALEGFEFGYTLPIPFIKLRPQIGVGNSTTTESFPKQSFSSSNLYLEPGVLLMIPFGHFFVGADVNALILPSESLPLSQSKTYVSLSVHGQVGVRF
jgi:hypothetical protein